MYFLYLDESGSTTTHFVLLGLAIPALSWRDKSTQVGMIKDAYQLSGKEILCHPSLLHLAGEYVQIDP